jgi:hypothetical protein
VPLLCDPLIGGAVDAASSGPRGRGAAPGGALAPEVAGALVNALEGMACACAMAGGGRGVGGEGDWSYDQALKLLLKMYREPSVVGMTSGGAGALRQAAVAGRAAGGGLWGRGFCSSWRGFASSALF